MSKKILDLRPTQSMAEQYELLYPILDGVFFEVKELSKKKQDGLMNKSKIQIINKILQKVRFLLKNDPSIEFLEVLDDVALPSNSDAVLVISQYKSAMEQYKKKHTFWNDHAEITWDTSDGELPKL